MKVLITHIRNEEYLLPWWLEHHKNRFDMGIVIDFYSTDNTKKLIKDICPEWMITAPIREDFYLPSVDKHVEDLEDMIWSTFPGAWIVSPTVTEFFIGDLSFLDNITEPSAFFIPQNPMVDPAELVDVPADPNIPLHKQRYYGIPWDNNPTLLSRRGSRVIRNYRHAEYDVGRHFMTKNVTPHAAILWYAYAPYTPEYRARSLGVRALMTKYEKINKWDRAHYLLPNGHLRFYEKYRELTVDRRDYISQFEK